MRLVWVQNVNSAPFVVDGNNIQWRRQYRVIFSVICFDAVLLCIFIRERVCVLALWGQPPNALKGSCRLQVLACLQVKAAHQITEVYPCFLCQQTKGLTLIQVNVVTKLQGNPALQRGTWEFWLIAC